jgi:hypothetical protein
MVLEAQNNPIKVSTYDLNWRDLLIAAMKLDTPVILSIFLAKPDDFLANLLKTSQWCRFTRKKFMLDWDGESIEVHKEFRLYLLLNRPLHLVPTEWLDYSTPISSYLDQEHVAELLLDHSLADYASTLRDLRKLHDVDIMNRVQREQMLENRGLEFITQLKPEQHLTGGELYEDVITNETKRKATAELLVDVKKLDRAMQSELGSLFHLI